MSTSASEIPASEQVLKYERPNVRAKKKTPRNFGRGQSSNFVNYWRNYFPNTSKVFDRM